MITKSISFPVPVHPVANIFPLMSDDEFDGLKQDIQEHGVREPLVFWQEQLIDGRNRMAACIELGINWNHVASELEDDIDPVSYIISHNLHRRHLSPSQRAMVAARIRETFETPAKQRQEASRFQSGKSPVVENLPPPSKARDDAGKAVGVSGRLVDHATTVIKHGSDELVAKVEAGDISVSKAAKIVKAPAGDGCDCPTCGGSDFNDRHECVGCFGDRTEAPVVDDASFQQMLVPHLQVVATSTYATYWKELHKIKFAKVDRKTTWGELDWLLGRVADEITGVVAERRDNENSRVVEALIVELHRAVKTYRRSVQNLPAEAKESQAAGGAA